MPHRRRLPAGLGRYPRRLHATYLLRKSTSGERARDVKPVDVSLAVMVAVIWGLLPVSPSPACLDEFSPEL